MTSPKKTAPDKRANAHRGLTQHLGRGGAMPMIMPHGTDTNSTVA